MADFQNNNSVAQAARVTGNRGVVNVPAFWQWVAQGKVFEAGQSLQSTGIDSQAETALTPDDVKASFALQAPSGSSTLVVPILFKAMFEGDGGAAADSWLIFTRSAGDMGVSLTLSGTAVNAKNNVYAANPRQNSSKATAYKGVATTFLLTVSALDTADDCVLYDMRLTIDAFLTTAGASPTGNQHIVPFLADTNGVPRILTASAAMIYYVSAATSDAVFHPYVMWAELEPEDLL